MEPISYVLDCTSNLIFLDEFVSAYQDDLIKLSDEQYKQSATTISESAIMFEFNNCLTRFYYRPFGLHKSLLIGATFSNDIWKVKDYFEDPSGRFILTHFKKYILNSSLTIYYQNEIAEDYFGTLKVVQLGHSPENQYSFPVIDF